MKSGPNAAAHRPLAHRRPPTRRPTRARWRRTSACGDHHIQRSAAASSTAARIGGRVARRQQRLRQHQTRRARRAGSGASRARGTRPPRRRTDHHRSADRPPRDVERDSWLRNGGLPTTTSNCWSPQSRVQRVVVDERWSRDRCRRPSAAAGRSRAGSGRRRTPGRAPTPRPRTPPRARRPPPAPAACTTHPTPCALAAARGCTLGFAHAASVGSGPVTASNLTRHGATAT